MELWAPTGTVSDRAHFVETFHGGESFRWLKNLDFRSVFGGRYPAYPDIPTNRKLLLKLLLGSLVASHSLKGINFTFEGISILGNSWCPSEAPRFSRGFSSENQRIMKV